MIDVVLPSLNEAAALPWVLERMPAGYRAIVVDNGSTDDTAAVAAKLGAVVVTESQRGFGAACLAGLAAAEAPVVAFCDADGSLDPQELPRVCDPVAEDQVDLLLGRRRTSTRRAWWAWPPHARLGNAFLARILRQRANVRLTDLGPMRAARRDALLALGMRDRRFGFPLEMVVRAAQAEWRIAETDVSYLPRTGRSKVTGTVRGTLRTIHDMRRVLRGVGDAG